MLIKTNYMDKKKSVYKCDKCKRKLNGETVIYIFAKQGKKHCKILDVCERCFNEVKLHKRKVDK